MDVTTAAPSLADLVAAYRQHVTALRALERRVKTAQGRVNGATRQAIIRRRSALDYLERSLCDQGEEQLALDLAEEHRLTVALADRPGTYADTATRAELKHVRRLISLSLGGERLRIAAAAEQAAAGGAPTAPAAPSFHEARHKAAQSLGTGLLFADLGTDAGLF